MTQQNVKDMILRNEGMALHRYLDPPGNEECRFAIGPGWTLNPHDHRSTITREVGLEMLDHAVRRAVEDVRMCYRHAVGDTSANTFQYKWDYSDVEPRDAALIDAAYNLGRRGLLLFKRMWIAIERCDFDGAAREMVDSRWWKNKLTRKRCERDAGAMRTNTWEDQ